MRGRLTFRMAFLFLALSAFVFSWTGAASAEKVTLAFDWLTYGKMAPFYTGNTQGFYKKENLEVKMVRGFGSIDTAKRVGAKQVEFGMSTLTDTITTRRASCSLSRGRGSTSPRTSKDGPSADPWRRIHGCCFRSLPRRRESTWPR